jgi:hypothetical protein
VGSILKFRYFYTIWQTFLTKGGIPIPETPSAFANDFFFNIINVLSLHVVFLEKTDETYSDQNISKN